jgi:uncharacterized membrane protein YfcA
MPAFAFLSDPLFWVAGLAALAAATVRGFSGFGAGLIFMPVGAACLDPKTAAGILYVIDTILIVPFVARAVGVVEWREVLPMGIAAMMTVPIGVVVLLHAAPVPLRWGLSIAILLSVGLLAAGYRYRGPTRPALSIGVGTIAGFLSGAVQIPGPPVLVYWLARDIVSTTMRANAIVFFCFTTVVSGIGYLATGIFTADVLARAAVLFPVYAAGMFIGSRMFGWASESTYRRIAYASVLFVAAVTLPVFS